MKSQTFKMMFLLLLPVVIGIGCKYDNEAIEAGDYTDVEFYKFSDFGCNSHWHLKSGFHNNHYIIESNEDFEKYIEIDCAPQIDFSEYNVIVGSKGFASGVRILSEKVEANNVELVYTVSFQTDISMVALGISYHIVVPKPFKKEIKIIEIVNPDLNL